MNLSLNPSVKRVLSGVRCSSACFSVLLGWATLVVAIAPVFAGCVAGPPLGLATSGPTTLDSAQARQSAGESAAPMRQLYDRWGTRWCFGAGAPVAGPPASGPDGQIYVGTHEGYVYAVGGT